MLNQGSHNVTVMVLGLTDRSLSSDSCVRPHLSQKAFDKRKFRIAMLPISCEFVVGVSSGHIP